MIFNLKKATPNTTVNLYIVSCILYTEYYILYAPWINIPRTPLPPAQRGLVAHPAADGGLQLEPLCLLRDVYREEVPYT